MSTRDLCRVVELMQARPEHSLICHVSLSLTRPNAPPQVATMHGTHAYCIYMRSWPNRGVPKLNSTANKGRGSHEPSNRRWSRELKKIIG